MHVDIRYLSCNMQPIEDQIRSDDVPGINETPILMMGMLLSLACICVDIWFGKRNVHAPEPKPTTVG